MIYFKQPISDKLTAGLAFNIKGRVSTPGLLC